MKNIYLIISSLALSLVQSVSAQISLTNAAPTYTQNFNSIGTSATATLPTNWKVGKNNLTTNTVGGFAAAGTATEQIAGNNMSSSATDGIYNYGAGVAGSATDRCIGGLSSATGTKSMTLFAYLKNNGTTPINDFTISYNIEKYRNGTNTAGFMIQMYYSADGSMWINAGTDFRVVVVGSEADNNGYTSAPVASTNISNNLNAILSAGNDMYLAWVYTVTSGTNTANAQALAIDDVSITGNFQSVTPVKLGAFTASLFNGQAKVKWNTYSEIDMLGYELEKSSDGYKFSKLSFIASNNSSTSNEYSHTDINLVAGNNFYRLKTIEKSGQSTYSSIIKVFVGKQAGIAINPTVVSSGSFNLQMNNIPKGQYQIAVYSNAGVPLMSKMLSTETEGTMSQNISLPAGTAKGLYIVRFYGKDANFNQKIMVQ